MGIWFSGNHLPKKSPSMRVWVRSSGSLKYTCVCEFRLEFLSYLKKKRKKKSCGNKYNNSLSK